MPQPIIVNGKTIYRPGVYATVDVSALAGRALEINRVAIVGNFAHMKQWTPTEFETATDLVNSEPSADILKKIAQLLFQGSNDPRVTGGPSTVTLVSVGDTSQAAITVPSLVGGSDGQFILKSKAWGATGNRVTVELVNSEPGGAGGLDITVARDGITEVFENVEQGAVCKVTYAGSDATKADMEVGPDTGIQITQEFEQTGDGTNDYDYSGIDEVAWGASGTGAVLNFAASGAGTETFTIHIKGLKDDGILLSTGTEEVVTFVCAGGVGTGASVNKYVRVDEVYIASSNGSSSGTVTTSTVAWDFNPTDFTTLGQAFAVMNAGSDVHKYAMTLEFPKAATVKMSEIDFTTGVDIVAVAAGMSPKADLQYLIDTINLQSDLVTAERDTVSESSPQTGCIYPEFYVAVVRQLVGGLDDVAPSMTDWETAFATLDKSKNIQIIVPITQDINVATRLVSHCVTMAGEGMSECSGWYGSPETGDMDALESEVNQINSRHVALVGQGIRTTDWTGKEVIWESYALALILAGIQAGTGIAVPMTHKRLNILGTIENDWTPNLNANTAIRKGVCAITRDRIGFRVERSVTSYVQDDNPIFTEVSANESLNTCIRDLRNYVEGRIGDANVQGMADLVRAIAVTRLNSQVEDGIIKAYDNGSLAVVDLGDRLRIDVRIAVVEPINFILINAEVVRNIT